MQAQEPLSFYPLREELALHAGPAAENGAPTWSLQDPVRNTFFRLDWLAFEVVSRWHLADVEAIARSVREETTLACEAGDVEAVLKFLSDNELLVLDADKSSAWYLERHLRRQQGVWQWLLHHYLFFRIPLWQPDGWLATALPWVAPLFGRSFRRLTGVALLIGLIEVARQWEGFRATLVDTFSWQGALGYAGALVFVKILHELGHAFTAKRYGCRVPTMGLAFLVLWPLAYTDVNDVWKLARRDQRLAVGAAGILTELAVAAWATLAWALLPDGVLRSMVFMLATTTWMMTLAINASPFLRFDGYFLLTDWLDMPNLHARAFALGRWRLREALFALGDPPPEHLSIARRRGLILFAYATWLYRLLVFLGIAVLVYHFVVKALGIFLAVIEIVWFIALPVWRELQVWQRNSERIRRSVRGHRIGWAVLVLLVATLLPLRFQMESQGLLRPVQSFPIVAPVAARIVSLTTEPVEAGQPVAVLHAPELELRAQQAAQKVGFAQWQVAAASVDAQAMARLSVLRQELAVANADASGTQAEIARLAYQAPFSGWVDPVDPDWQAGDWVARHAPIGYLVGPASWIVETYFPGTAIARIAPGDRGRFFPETLGEPVLDVVVESVDRDASRSLQEPMLAAPHGGRLLVRQQNQQLIPEQPVYKIRLKVATEVNARHLQGERRGTVVVHGRPESLLGPFLRNLISLTIREVSF